MKNGRIGIFLGGVLVVAVLMGLPTRPAYLSLQNGEGLLAGRNVNMISGQLLPNGDPFLQRQNEPSIAVSTRNPMHLLAGANDYRTVDMLIPYEELPGLPEGAAATRDAWLGVYKSYDGGQSWKSMLLPGFPQDVTGPGLASPLKAYGTAADPVIRAGTNGMFYYLGIAFTRNQSNNSVFVARFIDNNNAEGLDADTTTYIDARIIETGNVAKFIDKPWLAVDIPRSGAKKVTIPTYPTQSFYAGNLYVAYSVFTGQDPANPFSKVMVTRSLDCGVTWEKASFISESAHVNQGASIAIAPNTGYIYVVWRRFVHDETGSAIMMAYSVDGGKTFTKPLLVADVSSFDQGTSAYSFRTNSYPAITVDHNGVIYVAWAERGVGPGAAARIIVKTSLDAVTWSGPWAVDNHAGLGHQFQPTMTYGAGKVTCVWYDQRYDVSSHFDTYISDEPGLHELRHTIDVRAAQADGSLNPVFGASVPVTRYLHVADIDGALHQLQFSPPNYPLFKEGTRPFHGDYVDVASAPPFLPNGPGGWTYNTDASRTPVFHAAWTDNRNVKPPEDGNWSNYTPPTSSQDPLYGTSVDCAPGQTGMRNQDVYTAGLTRGLIVGSPANVKPLNVATAKHTFVVFVKNTTGFQKRFRLILPPVTGVTASFRQFSSVTEIEAEVAPASSVSRTVFATAEERMASLRVDVVEIDGAGGSPVPGGLAGTVVLNPDIENPDIENPDIENNEIHNPDIENPDIENPDIENVIVLNPDIENPDIENTEIINPDIENPDIENPDIENPDIENPGWLNPDIENPDIENPDIENGAISDYTWQVTNAGNTASAYRFRMIAAGFQESQYPGFGFQLLIYKVHTTPAATSMAGECYLTQKHQDELIANIVGPIIINPDIENPDIENPDIENPDIENATFWLGPGEKAYITLRVYDPDKHDGVFNAEEEGILGVTTSHAVNFADEAAGKKIPPIASPFSDPTILTTELAHGSPGVPYSEFLVALGGLPPYTWSLASGTLPPGLNLSTTGLITGTPATAGTWSFTVQVEDSSSPAKTATKSLEIHIVAPLQITTMSLPNGTVGFAYSASLQATGGHTPYSWSVVSGSLPAGLNCSPAGVISGTPTSPGTSSFAVQVTDDGTPPFTDTRSFSITATMTLNEWVQVYDGPTNGVDNAMDIAVDASGNSHVVGIISVSGGLDVMTIKYDANGTPLWQVSYNGPASLREEGIAVDIDPGGNVYVAGRIENSGVYRDWDILTIKYNSGGALQWVRTYNGPADDFDFATALVVDSAGNVYVTGESEGTGTGADYVTLKYDTNGTLQWSARYDGLGHGEDHPTDLALSPDGAIYVTGWSLGSGSGSLDYETVRYDVSTGTEDWSTRYHGGYGDDRAYAVVADATGVYVTGGVTGSAGNTDIVTIKCQHSNGQHLWLHWWTKVGNDHGSDIALDSFGNVYVSGTAFGPSSNWDYALLKHNASTGTLLWFAFYNGPANLHDMPSEMAVDPSGNVYVTGGSPGAISDRDYATVKFDPNGNELWARRYDGTASDFDLAEAIGLDSSGNVYVTGRAIGSNRDFVTIKYNPFGPLIYTVAGGGASDPGNGGPATNARLIYPDGIALDPAGNLFISEELNTHRVRRVDAATGIIDAFAGTGIQTGSIDGPGGDTADDLGDGGLAVNATLNDPSGLCADAAGNVYIADSDNNRVRRVATATGIITTVAGDGNLGYNGDGIPATSASLRPYDVALDSSGNLYIADIWNQRIRKVDALTGLISTVAGNGTNGFSGDGGLAVNASMSNPMGVCVDRWGNICISDGGNQRIRKVDAATGLINTIAGTGSEGYNGDGIPATTANLTDPRGVCVDYVGNLFIAEYNGPGTNCRVRKVNPATGIIITVAGTGSYSHALPEGIPAVFAEVNHPTGIAVDAHGNLWIAYYYQPRVRIVKVLDD